MCAGTTISPVPLDTGVGTAVDRLATATPAQPHKDTHTDTVTEGQQLTSANSSEAHNDAFKRKTATIGLPSSALFESVM